MKLTFALLAAACLASCGHPGHVKELCKPWDGPVIRCETDMLFAKSFMKIFEVGDIHGHLKALEALLEVVPFFPDDLIVFLGDCVDKGPDVRGVLEFLCGSAEPPNMIFLRGIHDQMLVDACLDSSKTAI